MPSEQNHEQAEGHYVAAGDSQIDDSQQDQQTCPHQQGKHRRLSDGPSGTSQKHVQNIHLLSRLQRRKRGGPGVCVAVEGHHGRREGDQQKASGRQRRIHEILSQTAEQHLHHQNRKYPAQRRHPQRHGHGKVQRQQQPRHHCGQIHDGHALQKASLIPSHLPLIYPKQEFRQHRAGNGHQNHRQRPWAEIVDAESGSRHQGNDDCQHQPVGGHSGTNMGIG